MKQIRDYCRRHSWCGDLKVAAVFLGLAAFAALIVVHSVPTSLIGN